MSLEAWGDENPHDADYDGWAERAREAGWFDPDDYSPGALEILRERERQEIEEGWTLEHDDAHRSAELAQAAAAYALNCCDDQDSPALRFYGAEIWPWSSDWWTPSADPRRDLIKAGALIAAEIDRLDRLAERAKG